MKPYALITVRQYQPANLWYIQTTGNAISKLWRWQRQDKWRTITRLDGHGLRSLTAVMAPKHHKHKTLMEPIHILSSNFTHQLSSKETLMEYSWTRSLIASQLSNMKFNKEAMTWVISISNWFNSTNNISWLLKYHLTGSMRSWLTSFIHQLTILRVLFHLRQLFFHPRNYTIWKHLGFLQLL